MSVTTQKNQNDKQNEPNGADRADEAAQPNHSPTTSGLSPQFVVGQVV